MTPGDKTFRLAAVHGMCGGVHAALRTVEEALAGAGGSPVYILHELVHNIAVTAGLTARGVRFVDRPEDIPAGAIAVIGAHGTAAAVESELKRRAGKLYDATCPLVRKLQRSAAAIAPQRDLVIIGHAGHPEVLGVSGHAGTGRLHVVSSPEAAAALPPLNDPAVLAQTTVEGAAVAAVIAVLKARYPQISAGAAICDASRQRQEAVTALAKTCQLVLVVGSRHSSNAIRLRETARKQGADARLIDNAGQITPDDLLAYQTVGITSGASTPEYLVTELKNTLQRCGFRETGSGSGN